MLAKWNIQAAFLFFGTCTLATIGMYFGLPEVSILSTKPSPDLADYFSTEIEVTEKLTKCSWPEYPLESSAHTRRRHRLPQENVRHRRLDSVFPGMLPLKICNLGE
jgi:hypothetical protein